MPDGIEERWEHSVEVLNDALGELRRRRDPRCLDSAEIEHAISFVLHSVTEDRDRAGWLESRITAIGAIAWLCWFRYHGGAPEQARRNLVLAVDLFGFVGAMLANVPAEVELFHAARRRDFDAFDGDYAAMNDTAGRMSEYGMRMGNEEILGTASSLLEQAVQLMPEGSPEASAILNNLASVTGERSRIARDAAMAVEAVGHARRALEMARADQRHRIDLLATLGTVLYNAAARTASRELATEAAEVLNDVVRQMPDDAYEKGGFLSTLGRVQALMWLYSREIEYLDASVHSHQLAVNRTSPADPSLVSRQLHLAMSRIARAEKGADPGELAEVGRSVEELSRHAETPMPDDKQLMGDVVRLAWELCRSTGLLDEAIRRGRAALEPDTPVAGDDLANVGSLLFERWTLTSAKADLDESVEYLSTAMNTANEAGPPPSRVVNSLSRALRAIWESTGNSAALRESIGLLKGLVDAEPERSSDRSMYLNNLGSMMLRLWEASGGEQNIDEALRHLRAACDCATEEDPGLPMYLHNLSCALASAWLADLESPFLGEAIAVARRAVAATPDEHPDRLVHLANLAGLLVQAWRSGDRDPALLPEAVHILRPTLDTVRQAEPGTGTFVVLLHYGETVLSLGQKLKRHELTAVGLSILRRAVGVPGGRPHHRVLAARRWGEEAAAAGRLDEAGEALSTAVTLLAQLPSDHMQRTDQEHALRRFPGLASEAAAVIVASGAVSSALSTLEQGRGVLLGRALTERAQLGLLRQRQPAIAARLEELRRLMDAFRATEPYVTHSQAETAADLLKRTVRDY